MHDEIVSTERNGVISVQNTEVTAFQGPSIGNLNITDSSQVHVGDKFVSVTQNVNNVELIKGKFLGLELVSLKRPNRLRCSVAVFLCWSVLVTTALIVYIVLITLPTQTKLDIGLNATWYLRREEWQAMAAYWTDYLELPLSYVIIGHTAANYCEGRFPCIEQMLIIQQDHLRRNLGDIGPNFLVGGEGFVFEGRGANVLGAVVPRWNAKSITILFMGNYAKHFPNQLQFDHLNVLLDVLVKEGVLRQDYTLYGHCQITPFTVPPGRHVMAQMDNFSHWNSSGIYGCL